ncbi:MAG: AbrB/MazE/SpoVT family DNA-binding domain-containing protein [bacterium]|nr:AbrB/MazE/SpoVT family DNA-binding domain-containing protein [bacterium]
MNTTTIQKWGNSYAVRIPIKAMNKLNLRAGNTVSVHESANGSALSIVPVKLHTQALSEMLSRITDKNRHSEIPWSDAVGNEVW